MVVYRVTWFKYVRDLSGEGSKLVGGRWNMPGIPVLYTSETSAGTILEFLVHAQQQVVPLPLGLIALEIPSSASIESVDVATLPENWRDSPPPHVVRIIGSEWAKAKKSLALRVPSVLAPHEGNLLLNPLHEDFKKVKPKDPEVLPIDRRLLSSMTQ